MEYYFIRIPGANPGDILNMSNTDMISGVYLCRHLAMHPQPRGRDIVINVEETDNVYNHCHDCNIVALTVGGSGAWYNYYYITSAIQTAPATETRGECWRLTATLAGMQTVISNSKGTGLVYTQNWRLSRAGLKDPSQTSEAVVSDKHVFRQLNKSYDLAASGVYNMAVTMYAMAIDDSLTDIMSEGGRTSTDPATWILTNSSGYVLSGNDMFYSLATLLDEPDVRPYIYRIQLIPTDFLVNLDTEIKMIKHNKYSARYCRRLRSGLMTSPLIQPSTSPYLNANIYYRKSYGSPKWSYEYAGNVLGTFDVMTNATSTGVVAPVNAILGYVTNQGVNAYVRFIQSSSIVGMASLPLPEIIGAADASTSWYQTTGQTLLNSAWQTTGSTVAMSVTSAAAGLTAGGPLGGLIAGGISAAISTANVWRTTERNYEQGLRQAKQTLFSVGSGPINFYAMTIDENVLKCYLERISDTAAADNEQYFRRNGYSCSTVRTNLTTLDRNNFEHFEGAGTFTIYRDKLYQLSMTYNELLDKANEELSAGITVWNGLNTVGDYSQANGPVS